MRNRLRPYVVAVVFAAAAVGVTVVGRPILALPVSPPDTPTYPPSLPPSPTPSIFIHGTPWYWDCPSPADTPTPYPPGSRRTICSYTHLLGLPSPYHHCQHQHLTPRTRLIHHSRNGRWPIVVEKGFWQCWP